MRTKKFIAASLILTLLSSVAVAQSADPAMIEAARKEGSVVWYTGMIVNQIVRPLVDAFEAKYPGIKVQYSRASGNDNALKIINEARARRPLADMFDASSALNPLLDAKLVEVYRPRQAERFPPDTKDPAGYWTSPNVYYFTTAYNTELVKAEDAPQTYDDLLHPKWQGKIAWTYDLTPGGPPGFIYNILALKGQDQGMDYLRALAKQKPVSIPAAQRVVLDKVIAGEYPLALMTLSYHSTISAAKGAPVQWLKMSPMVMTPNTAGLVRNAPHPNAAKLLLEFLLTTEAQEIFAANDYMPSDPAIKIKNPDLLPTIGKFATQVITPEMARTDLTKWIAIYNELYK